MIQTWNSVSCTEVEGVEIKVGSLGNIQEVTLSGTCSKYIGHGDREGEVTGMAVGFLAWATARIKQRSLGSRRSRPRNRTHEGNCLMPMSSIPF